MPERPPRTARITFRLTPEERELLEARAAQSGLRLGPYVLAAALGRPLPRPIPAIDRQLAANLGRIGGLLNQAVHAINAGLPPLGPRHLLADLRSEVLAVQAALRDRAPR